MSESNSSSKKSPQKVVVIIIVAVFLLVAILSLSQSGNQVRTIDSNDLEQTAIMKNYDSNLPTHKNVIWCSTFQMAWDKFKKDIIKEPILLIDAQDLADQMNNSEFPSENLDANSYYTAAGFVKDSIIKKIQADMAERFPDAPRPVFGEGYHVNINPLLVYAYLNTNIKFKYSFYTYDNTFAFENSNKKKTNVTAFSSDIEGKGSDGNYAKIRDQINILYFEAGKDKNPGYFAVDLCKYTQPYQVILALVPQKNTFEEMISDVENKINEYKNTFWYQPDFMPSDKLVVPDIFYRIKHVYTEFLMKEIGNEPFESQNYVIFDAQQTIDFSLNKGGVVLKSEGRLGGGGMLGGAMPRFMYFNRPFLIYIKKRQPNSKPFFAMWIDNAELLKKQK